MMIKIIYSLIISVLVAVLISCGNDENSNKQIPSGVFNGIFAKEEVMILTWGNTAHVLSNNDITSILSSSNTQMEINFLISDSEPIDNDLDIGSADTVMHITGLGRLYDSHIDTLREVNVFGWFTETSFILTIADADNDGDKMLLSASTTSNNNATLAQLKGTYFILDIGGSMTIDNTGLISGSDNNGCEYEGDINIPNTDINIYKIFLTVFNCSSSGHYGGLGTFDHSSDNFIFSVSNKKRLLQYRLLK
ncbi:hypothetical protein HWV00_04690 [Moritella sp. 24]|uniref:hypothetical protein n=1 Tax=Moritella sp. 24 TaxID=2746230 RepID=UPI001BA7D599|nr:hypothetical protein [Moritella sp. 24]QUM75584.1 hypothetical protein HWV00_04690 [Moritella sp. 24]